MNLYFSFEIFDILVNMLERLVDAEKNIAFNKSQHMKMTIALPRYISYLSDYINNFIDEKDKNLDSESKLYQNNYVILSRFNLLYYLISHTLSIKKISYFIDACSA